MNKYNEQYYITERIDESKYPSLCPDSKTANRPYDTEKIPFGEAPLVFQNAWKEDAIKNGIKEVAANVLFEGNDLVVCDSIRNELVNYPILNLQMYPSIFTDKDNNWYENYWYLNFYQHLDCWDRRTSEYNHKPRSLTGWHDVYIYSLDSSILDEIPEDNRLMFKIGGTILAPIFIHERLLNIFKSGTDTGTIFIKVSEYED